MSALAPHCASVHTLVENFAMRRLVPARGSQSLHDALRDVQQQELLLKWVVGGGGKQIFFLQRTHLQMASVPSCRAGAEQQQERSSTGGKDTERQKMRHPPYTQFPKPGPPSLTGLFVFFFLVKTKKKKVF